MKKALIVSIISVAMFSMVACSGNITNGNVSNNGANNSVESSDNNNKGEIEDSTSKEEGKDNALTDSSEDKTDSKEEETNPSENGSKEEASSVLTITQGSYISYDKTKQDEEIKSLEEEFKGKGKNPITISAEASEYIEIIETGKDVTNVTIHDLGEEFYECEMDLDVYMEKYKDVNTTVIAKKLSSKDVILLPCNVGEGIPQVAISWVDSSGKLIYQAISYNGKGE